MGLSILSDTSLEEVAQESPNTVKFLQMQFFTDLQLMATLLKRGEKAGYKAVLLTVDSPTYGKHKKRARFHLPGHLQYANFSAVQKEKGFQNNEELKAYIRATCWCSSTDWKKLRWLRSITPLPLVVKGILTAEDARLAVQHGVQGILVSNHGGRQLDGVQATVSVINIELSLLPPFYSRLTKGKRFNRVMVRRVTVWEKEKCCWNTDMWLMFPKSRPQSLRFFFNAPFLGEIVPKSSGSLVSGRSPGGTLGYWNFSRRNPAVSGS